ncbi:1-aminocyclopropane-1-carboxylate oxidase homolog 1-like [Apium graveolens]|uniref:1-aminocyclopropane-1-carboxylate oxidase homolog 1-like n=1 Tax=Apium graveolens TaxID=4045 RepID=UPI003D7B2C9D
MGTFVLDALSTPGVSIQKVSLVPPRRIHGTSQVSFTSFKPLPVPTLRLTRSKYNTSPVLVIRQLPVPWKKSNINASHVASTGLVGSGFTSIPGIFDKPPKYLNSPRFVTRTMDIPVIDLAAGDRSVIARQVQEVACSVGFFQIINHGVPLSLMDDMILAIKTGSELEQADRKAVAEWDEKTKKLGDALLSLLSEGFGLKREELAVKLCMEAGIMTGNYYPYHPHQDLTAVLNPVIFTLLLSNQIPGLQVEVEGHEWAKMVAHPGALVLNVGEILQTISNGKYKSVEHRILAADSYEPLIPVPVPFNPAYIADIYGPLHIDETARYHDFEEVDAKSSTKNFSIDSHSKWRDWNPLRPLGWLLTRIV